jgi:hypothetical protein
VDVATVSLTVYGAPPFDNLAISGSGTGSAGGAAVAGAVVGIEAALKDLGAKSVSEAGALSTSHAGQRHEHGETAKQWYEEARGQAPGLPRDDAHQRREGRAAEAGKDEDGAGSPCGATTHVTREPRYGEREDRREAQPADRDGDRQHARGACDEQRAHARRRQQQAGAQQT